MSRTMTPVYSEQSKAQISRLTVQSHAPKPSTQAAEADHDTRHPRRAAAPAAINRGRSGMAVRQQLRQVVGKLAVEQHEEHPGHLLRPVAPCVIRASLNNHITR